MGKKRTAKEQLTDMLKKLGRKGGKKRMESMTPEARKELARAAAQARWKKKD